MGWRIRLLQKSNSCSPSNIFPGISLHRVATNDVLECSDPKEAKSTILNRHLNQL